MAVPDLSQSRVSGRVELHRDGYAFVIPNRILEGVEGDIYVRPDAVRNSMHGDHVLARIIRLDRAGRAEGEILKILERGNVTVVGTFRRRRKRNFVEPHDPRLQQWIEIPPGKELPSADLSEDRIGASEVAVAGVDDLEGMVVNVEIIEFPQQDESPVGRVIEVLGKPDDFGVDVEIVIRKYHIPHRFPPAVLEQAQNVPAVIHQADLEGRRDFRGFDVVTIDGETARDFDDAVWVDKLPNGRYALHVHIADVSHYVRPGSPIDAEAALRGTSVYFPDRAVPMLPLELSTEICSLKPRVDRLAMSALLEIDHRGETVAQEFTRSVIRSVERMTYANLHLALDGDAGLRERYASLIGRFELMRELALILNRRRARRGSIDFDLPEPLIEFDEFGEMTGIARAPRNIAHRIIEEFMLAANEAVASHLEHVSDDMLYRVHEPPDPKRVLDFEEVAAGFGASLGIGGARARRFAQTQRTRDGRKLRRDVVLPAEDIKVTSRHYQRLIAKFEGRPEERILNYLMLRSLKQARYAADNAGHFALAAPSYTHFTSPIRRYPDLVVHRILGGWLDRRPDGLTPAGLQKIAAESSDTERRAADAERELVEWKKVNFMAERVGDEFPALIVGTMKFGFFVELEELFVEGLVPVDTLPGDRYGYEETTRKIVGARTRRRFSIGDRLTVRLDRIDALERRLYFSLVEPAARRRGNRPPTVS
ncbi:MAG: VacB/RNase II family 3'-5' exoribonuclease [Bryobacteraceae bacterium]|nr:VacB/RNase II family 3'-5' exoribonuclease [Bryobacteraceae bacterium]